MHYYFSRPKHFHLSHFLALSLALSGRCFVQTKRTHCVLEHCHCLFVTKKHPRADAFLIFQQCSLEKQSFSQGQSFKLKIKLTTHIDLFIPGVREEFCVYKTHAQRARTLPLFIYNKKASSCGCFPDIPAVFYLPRPSPAKYFRR